MLLLILYVSTAIFFSFLCSIAEAVLLSVTSPYISVLEKNNKKSGVYLRELKNNINKAIAAILTLNTIAHTVGAVGAGAQATVVFGSEIVGIASVVLTLLILIFSEIIPKTIGANYWRELAPATAYFLIGLTKVLLPFVWLSELITRGIGKKEAISELSREEFAAMAEMSADEGVLEENEYHILQNLLKLKDLSVDQSMTPSPVIFSVSDELHVAAFVHKYDQTPYSRILLYKNDRDNIVGFALRRDILLGFTRGNTETPLKNYRRDLGAILNTSTLAHALKEMLSCRSHILLVVDEYGSVKGILTLEDVFETLLDLDIIDEMDKINNLRNFAKKSWKSKKELKEQGNNFRS